MKAVAKAEEDRQSLIDGGYLFLRDLTTGFTSASPVCADCQSARRMTSCPTVVTYYPGPRSQKQLAGESACPTTFTTLSVLRTLSSAHTSTASIGQQAFHLCDQIFHLRQDLVFHLRLIGDPGIQGGYAADGGVQAVEQFVGDAGGDFGGVAE
jgi:hypothetical protein